MTDFDRTTVVTGAGGGIGLAMCRAFAIDGARVLAVDIDADAAGRGAAAAVEAGGQAEARACDVGDPAAVDALAAWVDRLGGADVLCNNAGVFDGFTSVTETSTENWDRVVAVNLTGPFLVTRAMVPGMRGSGGAIVNTASVAGLVAGAGGVAYTATKHGVVGLTRQLAQELGADNIRVNAIAPGVIATGMSMPMIEDPDQDDQLATMIGRTPARRLGQEEEVARLAVFLASEEASFIQGAVVPIDGGWTAI